ncbi:GIY-YIG nuclease family protein [Inquilinus limosus]|uniref:GIY-YIG nuclease family protein n=1 Tax=Inquilinus limosus TaxID=171674 RepID=UPI001E6474B8|nr:GIY-YIG nuclease family protein [Inquilinus limosus]
MQPFVYIVANKRNGTLYVGVTSNLPRRAYEHRTGTVEGFSSRHGCKLLVWCEPHDSMRLRARSRSRAGRGGPS